MVGKDSNSPLSQVMRFSSETLAPRDRIAQWREVFGRQVFRIDIEPLPDSQFIGDVTLHALPGLKHMSGIVGHGVRAARTQELISDGNDDLNLTVNLTGSICVSQRGEELVLRDRQAVFTSLGEVGGLVRDMPGKSLGLHIPRAAIAPLVPGLDDALMRPIPRDCAALRLLTSYVGVLQDIASPAEPDLCRLIVNEIYDLVAVTIGASRDAREVANGRRVRAPGCTRSRPTSRAISAAIFPAMPSQRATGSPRATCDRCSKAKPRLFPTSCSASASRARIACCAIRAVPPAPLLRSGSNADLAIFPISIARFA